MEPKKMSDFHRILAIWTTIATNTRLRDRMVKVIQYGSQMLIGYYGAKMSEELLHGIRTTRRSASTARKAFWLLKSINHINSIVTMVDNGILHQPLAVQLDFIEQVSLVFYYLYENGIFFARCNMFGVNEDDLDWGCNVTWFIGDLAFFLSSGLRLHNNVVERKKLIEQIVEIDKHRRAITAANSNSNSPLGSRSPSSVDSQLVIRRRQQLENDIQQLSSEQRDLLLSFAIVSVPRHTHTLPHHYLHTLFISLLTNPLHVSLLIHLLHISTQTPSQHHTP